ncbi:hypothetical protein F5144DRAFT_174509 [Chaetomium tenue]|uniref:Uncharacterized protein n=1 Tax=Chaetomium tenue TaxID=1854479 RepID=A0ACB7PGZ8_9PEZI|nr:hypothetical protein F5144DRAFT_174509 [Chaetomium globosum]
MHRNQHNHRSLEPFTVKPGPETGLYYILVANLAHRTTWRDLKAFASQACEVDHAEVYPPTSGFVRVRGRANFEKAFKYLDGNTLEYRALQADARNMNQATVVKLLPTDYHAMRIMRGDNGRVVSEPEDPAPDASGSFSQGAGTAMGSPYPSYHGNASPSFSMADTQWGYVTSSSYSATGGYQPAPAAPLTPPSSSAYQPVAVSNHGLMPQVAVGPHPTAYHAIASPTPAPAPARPTHYQYSDAAGYYPPGTTYGARGPGYAGFVQPAVNNSSHAYSTGDDWPVDPIPPPQQDQIPNYDNTRPTVVVEQRKIIIRDLERDGLSEAVVTSLLAKHAGIGGTPGQIEKLELPFNKDGKARGTAYITFGTTELANAAVAALDGRKMGARRMSARLVVEGVSPNGFDSGRPGRRHAGGGGGGKSASRGWNSKADVGKPPRSPHSQFQSQSQSQVQTQTQSQAQDQAQAQAQAQAQFQFQPSQSTDTLSQPAYSTTPTTVPALLSAANSNQAKTKEERPVIVDGSGGRFKKASAPVVVDGSAGKKGDCGRRGPRR